MSITVSLKSKSLHSMAVPLPLIAQSLMVIVAAALQLIAVAKSRRTQFMRVKKAPPMSNKLVDTNKELVQRTHLQHQSQP